MKAYKAKGDLLQDLGKIADARKAFTAYNLLCERMVSEYGASHERELSISYERIGDICQAQGDIPGAREYFLKDFEICERLAAGSPDSAEAQRDLSVCCKALGNIGRSQNDLPGAKEYYLKALETSERFAVRFPDCELAQDDLADTYYEFSFLEGMPVTVQIDYVEEAIKIWERLFYSSGNKRYKRKSFIAGFRLHLLTK